MDVNVIEGFKIRCHRLRAAQRQIEMVIRKVKNEIESLENVAADDAQFLFSQVAGNLPSRFRWLPQNLVHGFPFANSSINLSR